MMDKKLTKEQRDKLIQRFKAVAEDDMLNGSDAVKIIDILIEACEREKAAVSEDMMVERFKLQ